MLQQWLLLCFISLTVNWEGGLGVLIGTIGWIAARYAPTSSSNTEAS